MLCRRAVFGVAGLAFCATASLVVAQSKKQQPAPAPKSMSVEEARKVAASTKKNFATPPRTIDDIAKVLDQNKPDPAKIAQLKKTVELDDSFPSAHRSLARAYLKTRNHPGHVEESARHFELIGEPQAAALMRESFANGGWEGFVQAMTGRGRPTRYFFPFYAAVYYAERGEKDRAFAELDTTYQEIAGVAMPGRWVSMGVTIR